MKKEGLSLIKEKDVIRMKVPFPDIVSGLAVRAHMYICERVSNGSYGFVKCQTLKPKMIGSKLMLHYIDEPADINRNPFSHTSRIDCDKLFTTDFVAYKDEMKTTSRPDVCHELFSEIQRELYADGYSAIPVDEEDLVSINVHIIMKTGLE